MLFDVFVGCLVLLALNITIDVVARCEFETCAAAAAFCQVTRTMEGAVMDRTISFGF